VELLVIRHAIAEDREVFAASGRDDALRPLTPDGVRKMRRAAHGLHELVPSIDVLAASPLARAEETAEIVRREYELDRVEIALVLQPETPLDEVIAWLARFDQGLIAVVGHEPQLGRLVTYLVSAAARGGVELKKGGACLIDFEGSAQAGKGRLVWAVPPRILRDLAG
jgi:phosphohistidine phosphatase